MPHAFNVSRIEIDASFNIKYDKMELYIGEFNGHWSGLNFKNGAKKCGPTKENLNNLRNKHGVKKRLKLKTSLNFKLEKNLKANGLISKSPISFECENGAVGDVAWFAYPDTES